MQGDDASRTMAVLDHLGMDRSRATGIAEHICGESRRIPALYDDALDTLRHLKELGLTTGIVSSRPPRQMEEIVTAHGLAGLFDIVVPLDCSTPSPDGSWLGRALERHGFRAGGTLRVTADLPEEGQGSRTTDEDTIVVDRHLAHILDDRAVKIRSLGELQHLVRRR